MGTKTGPIRMLIGPLKANLSKHQRNGTAFLQEDVPTDAEGLRDNLHELCKVFDGLETATKRLQTRHDEWIAMLQELPDEQTFYEKACEELVTLLLDSDDLFNELRDQRERRQQKLDALYDLSHVAVPNPSTPPPAVNLPAPNISTAAQPPLQPQPTPQTSTPQTSVASHTHQHNVFKAPKINLPKFSGDIMEFKQFWGIFEANIHTRTDFNKVEKFSYLLSQLEGEAKRAIAGIMISESNYDEAVALLKTRFDRADDRLVTMLYSEFIRIPHATRKASEKQRTLDDCERVFRQLETAGEDLNSNRSLVFGLLSKFPPGMIRDLQRYYNVGPHDTLNDVRAGLRKAIQEEEATIGMLDDLKGTREDTRTSTAQGTYRSFDTPRRPQAQEDVNAHQSSTSALATMTRPTDRSGRQNVQLLQPPTTCYFCSGNHFNDKCTAYVSAKRRIDRLTELGRCPHCLKFHGGTCWMRIRCIHCRSNGLHASALCPSQHPEQIPNSADTPHLARPSAKGDATNRTTPSGITALNAEVKPALFQTAKTVAVNPVTGQRCQVRLAMDTMSSRHYVKNDIATKLGLAGEQSEKLCVAVFGSSKTVDVPTTRVEFDVALRDGSTVRVEANTTRIICQANVVHTEWTEQERKALDCFQGALADDPFDGDGAIDILIGASLVWELIEGPRISTHAPGLFLIPSKLGLMLSGESQQESDRNEPTMLCITESPCQFPNELGLISCHNKFEPRYPDIDEFWDLEKIGISDDPNENDDDKASENFEKTVKFEDGRYQVTWPWIEEKRELLPTNYEIAYDRFRSLSKRLRRNPDLVQGYQNTLTLQLERNIIEEVPAEEIETDNPTHYLPHHPVFKASSNTTKLRIVFDAASKKERDDLSLNECMLRGPVILPHLCHLLLRMRVHEIVVISDIEKAFLQVGLQPHERDVTRFLWFRDDNDLNLKDNIIVYRFTRVNFGWISNTFLLAATINHHITIEDTEFAEELRDDIYVDNVISGLDEDDDPLEYYHQLKALFLRAGMNIQEFCSNSKSLMRTIPEVDRVSQTDVKVLGLRWDSQGDDTLRLAAASQIRNPAIKSTKRKVLQTIASVFDPMGFYLPVLLPAKYFLQRLWGQQCDWDDELTMELQNEWETLRASLMSIFEHRIQRFIGQASDDSTLAVFCDASSRAYATAVYLRGIQADGTWTANLIFAKSRLSPSNKKGRKKTECNITLPRLELLGAVIGARAGNFCRQGLKLPKMKIDFFIDSQCVLHWINSKGLLKRFVANRVEEIQKVTHCAFHYVNTHENPADLGTRGKLPDELFSSDLWWTGPDWLAAPSTEWPEPKVPPMTDETIRELKAKIQPLHFGHTLVATEVASQPRYDFLSIDPKSTSTFSRLIRLSVWWVKFLKMRIWDKLSAETQNPKHDLEAFFQQFTPGKDIDATEYEAVKVKWLKCSQGNHYPDVLDKLQNPNFKRKAPLIISQLGLQLDDAGLIRTFGRYQNADLPEAMRQPILLPRNDHVTMLLVTDLHEGNMHVGVSHTLSLLRQKYWVPHGRALVRSVIHKCLVCRRYKTARPFKLPPMPPWPKERMQQSAPFHTTGLDYFGPVTVKTKESKTKMWVCLFTCLSTRAIHLEPVLDCSAQEFLHSVIRFVSRRGTPAKIISDNAAQFSLVKILGDKAWKRTPVDENVTAYAANHGITWQFITELAPWQGGFYERLVGIIKAALRTTIRNRLLTWTDLVTLVTEAEAVVNSRPITYINDDIDSRLRAIRPIDFLIVNSSAICDSPDGSEVTAKNFGEAGKRLVAIWKQRCKTLENLWKHWREEYVLSLRERQTIAHKAGRSDKDKEPDLGQVILLLDPDAPRGQWKLARITKILTGTDGRVRSVELRLSNGTQLRRAINHIVPLEVEQKNEINETEPNESNEAEEVSQDVEPTTEAQRINQHIESETRAESNDDESDDDSFQGFSKADVQRTMQLLRDHDFSTPNSCSNFYFIDLANRNAPDNFFVNHEGMPSLQFLDHDRKYDDPQDPRNYGHPNVNGIRRLWRAIVKSSDELRQLGVIQFATSSKNYQAGTLNQTQSLI